MSHALTCWKIWDITCQVCRKTFFKFSYVYCTPREKHLESIHFLLKGRLALLSMLSSVVESLAEDQAHRHVPKYCNLPLQHNDSVGMVGVC